MKLVRYEMRSGGRAEAAPDLHSEAAVIEPLLNVRGVTTGYGSIVAVRDVSIRVAEGELVSLVGPNGAGKTTLLLAIMGALRLKAGSIQFNGRTINGLPTQQIVRAGLTLVPEGRRIFSSLTVEENLLLGSAPERRRHQKTADSYDHLFSLFPVLKERRKTLGGYLSGGEQQQLAIARALLSSPKLLLLDEPSLGLAPRMVSVIFDLIGRLREQGMTIVLVEQNVRQALRLSDRAYVLRSAEVVLEGSAQDLASLPELHEVYLGGIAATADGVRQ